ncbi:MAG TPA: amino-acid N-acetyltransferase, partial [Spirochaetia bacterium]|nr:amino-acid N-acetyltransferase [Spirochaetia bacterium]
MHGESVKEQVDQIREVFTYVERFKGSLFIIKIDFSIIEHPLLPSLIEDIAKLHRVGIRIIIVVGARQRIDEILSVYRIPTRTIGQIRISSPDAMPFIKMAAFDAATKVMTSLSANSISAVIGNWVRARSMGVVQGIDYQYTGSVEKVRAELVDRVLGEGLVPIFPCIGWNALGEPYNLSSDELAAALGRHLGADKVFYVTDSAEIETSGYRLPEEVSRDRAGRIFGLRLDEAARLLEMNADREDAHWYGILRCALETCKGGVKRVHIVDGRVEGVLLKEVFTSLGSGTMVYANEYESIRAMRREDVSEVLHLMEPFIRSGVLVKRDEASLDADFSEYVVYEVDGTVHGCGALKRFGDDAGEIAGIAVDENYSELGIGFRIVSYL